VEAWRAAGTGEGPGYIYSRNRNPTVELLEEKIRILDGAEAATSFATGMGAVSGVLYTFLSAGDRVVSIRDTYGETEPTRGARTPRSGCRLPVAPPTR
jgi:cystathionine gamma-synthase